MAGPASDAPAASPSSRIDGESQVRRSSPKIPAAPPVPKGPEFDIDLSTSSGRISHELSIPPAVAQIGRYSVLGRIAVGGMAEIHLAQETSSGGGIRLVILKVLRQQFEDDHGSDPEPGADGSEPRTDGVAAWKLAWDKGVSGV